MGMRGMHRCGRRGHRTRARCTSLTSLSDHPNQRDSARDTAPKGREVLQRGKAGRPDYTPGRGDRSGHRRSQGVRSQGVKHRQSTYGGWRSVRPMGRGGSNAHGLADSTGVHGRVGSNKINTPAPIPRTIHNFPNLIKNDTAEHRVPSCIQMEEVRMVKPHVYLSILSWRKLPVRV